MDRKPVRRSIAVLLIAAAIGLVMAATPTRAAAAGNATARIMLHALATTAKNPCARAGNMPSSCSGYYSGVNNLSLYPTIYYAYPLVVNASQTEGVKSASFGVTYNPAPQAGVEIYSWTLCADTETPNFGWPNSGGGNIIEFTVPIHCQTAGTAALGGVVALGYFYCAAYSPDLMAVVPHPGTNKATVTNCAGIDDHMLYDVNPTCSELGQIGFSRSGLNRCGYSAPLGCFPCTFDGPTVVTAGEPDIVYKARDTATKVWHITGNGTIVGSNTQTEVHVNAGATGAFTLSVDLQYDISGEGSRTCRKTVTVQDAVPVQPATWGRIKALSGVR